MGGLGQYYAMFKDLVGAAKALDGQMRIGWDNSGSMFPQVKFGAPRRGSYAGIPIAGPPVSSRYQGPGSIQRPAYRSKYGGVKTMTKYKKKGSWKGKSQVARLKREQYIMKKQLRMVPPAPKDLILDQVPDRWTSGQGLVMWQSAGGLTTKNGIATTLAGGPTNIPYFLNSIPSVDPINSFVKGRSKVIRHEWGHDIRATNLSNCPIELTCFTLKCRKRVSMDADDHSGLGFTDSFFIMLKKFFYNQFGVNTSTNPQYGPTHPSFKLTDLNRFNEFFKIVKTVKNVVQPGEALLQTKFSKKARTFDSSKQFNWSGGSADFQVHYEKGDLLYVWRQCGVPQSQESKTATDVTLCDTAMDVVHSFRIRPSVLPYAQYDAVATPGQLSSGQTIKLIFPGTSAAGTAAPAT